MKINKVFNKKIIITLIATFTILISGVFGTSKIFAEEGETENKTYYNEENMHKTDDLGYIPIELEEKVFELTDIGFEVEGDIDGSIEQGGDAYIYLTLKVVDDEIINLIESGKKLKYDFSFVGIHSEKIILKEVNQIKFRAGFVVNGLGLDSIFDPSELDMFFDDLFEYYDLTEEIGNRDEQVIDFTYYLGLRIYNSDNNIIRELDMPLPLDQYPINYYSNNSILETSELDFESGINFKKFLNGNSFVDGEKLRVDNGFLEVEGYEEDVEIKYSIKFLNIDGSLIDVQDVVEEEAPITPKNVEHPENAEKYKFIGWDKDIEAATEDMTYTAVFEINKFEVIFFNHLGEQIDVQVVNYGEKAVAPEIEKELFDRTFEGWDNEFEIITEDISINPIYSMKNILEISFFNSDGSMIEFLEVYEGDEVIIPTDFEHPENPEKYEFSNWDRTVELIARENERYYAEYKIRKFNVKFFDLSGELIGSEIVEYGESVYAPELEKKELFDRVFTNWEEDVFIVTADKEIHPQFEMKNLYTLIFKNYDGTIIETMTLYEGQRAIIEDPTYESEIESHEYVFINWSDKFNGYAERDAEYTARYRVIRRFNVVFKNIDGTLLSDDIYIEGERVIVPENFNHPSGLERYEFTGWGTEFSVTADKDIEYVAEYRIKTFIIEFEDLNGDVIDTQIIEYGGSAVFPEFSQETVDKIFTGWKGSLDNIIHDKRFIASFEMKELFFITFKNVDGSIIEVLKLYHGQPIEAPIANFASDNELFEYVFTGWNKELDEVAEKDVEYFAQYELIKRFRVVFRNVDGSIISEGIYLEGDSITSPNGVIHPENSDKYNFIGWNKEIVVVNEDADYIAIFEINTFTVSFYDNDNRLIERQTILYGENANHPEKNLDKFDRIFIEWDSSLENITENKTINAVYEMKKIYTYTFLNYDKSVIEVLEFYEGQEVIAPEATYLSGQNSFDFIFSHWNPELQEFATEDATYEAVYDVIEKYKIVFKDINGETVSEQLVLKGELPEAPLLPHPTENHKFVQDDWNNKVIPAESDQIYEVRYKLRTFTVDFYFDHKPQRISRQTVEFGNDAVAPSTEQERYTFLEWDVDFTNVTENIRVTGIFEENDHVLINFIDTDGNLIHSIKNYGDIEAIDLGRDYSFLFDQPLHKFGYDISKIYELIITEGLEEEVYYNFGKELEINQYREHNFIIEYEERELHEVTIVLFDGTEIKELVYNGYFPQENIPSVPDYKFYGFVHNDKFLQEEFLTPGHIGLRIYQDETIRLFYTDNSPFYKEIEIGKNYEIHDIPNNRTWLFKDLVFEAGNYHFIFKTNHFISNYGSETRIVNVVISEEGISMMVASIAPTRQKLLLGSGYFIVNSQTIIGDKIVVENINSDYEFLTFFSTREGQFSLNKGHIDFSDEDIDETPGDNEKPYIPPKDEWKLTIQNVIIVLFGITVLVVIGKFFKRVFGKNKKGRRRWKYSLVIY